MRLDSDSREYLFLDVTVDVDPASATFEVSIDTGPFTVWEWTGAAVSSGTGAAQRWTRTGRKLFAGPDAPLGTATLLPLGRHLVRWRLTGLSVEQPSGNGDPIDVK